MAKKITFHSYKGGSGRSSTTYNTIPYLVDILGADESHPVLLLDVDIDSAGLTYLLGTEEYFLQNNDVKKLLKGEIVFRPRATSDLANHPLISNFVPVGDQFGVEKGAVLFLGVNDKMKIDNKEIDGSSQDLLNRLAVFADNNPAIKAIVMDSASGVQTVANFATNFADTLVCCMRPTVQFRYGTRRFLEHLEHEQVSKRIVLLPTVVPTVDVEVDGVRQREEALGQISAIATKRRDSISVDDSFVKDDCFGINEVQRFKWCEGVLYKLEREGALKQEDEKLAASRYRKLAEVLSEE